MPHNYEKAITAFVEMDDLIQQVEDRYNYMCRKSLVYYYVPSTEKSVLTSQVGEALWEARYSRISADSRITGCQYVEAHAIMSHTVETLTKYI